MTFLLDVNVLIALVDPDHIQYDLAHDWFQNHGRKSWATCPLTENGVVRIVGNANYPGGLGTPASSALTMTSLRKLPGHVFWPDDISLLDGAIVDTTKLLSHSQVTDTYLLALAVKHGGQLATFDRRLVTTAVRGGAKALCFIG